MKNNKKLLRGLSATTAAAVVFSGGYALTTKAYAEEIKTPAYTEDDFNKEVAEFMLTHPTVNEESAKAYIALINESKLKETNPDLLYKLTGIYEYKELTEDEFNNLTVEMHSDLMNKGIGCNIMDTRKLLAIINIDQLVTDNPDFLAEIVGKQTPAEFITDAFKVTSAIKNVNYDTYAKENSTENLVRLSKYVYDLKSKTALETIEAYADEAHEYKEDAAKQNQVVTNLMADIQMPDGKLFCMEEGIGFASTIAFDGLINYISFNEKHERQLTPLNFSALMNHDTLEFYLSNIFGYIGRACTDSKTKTK